MFISSASMSGLGCSGCLYPCGSDLIKCNTLWTSSSCGMFVYRDYTSIEVNLQLVGSLLFSIILINSVVSLMYEGRFFMYGCNHLLTNCDILSVMLSQLETMGRIPIGFL